MNAWGLLGQTVLQSLVLFVVFVALYDIAERAFRPDRLLAFCATACLLGVIGYLVFWLAWLSYPLSSVVKIALIVLLLIQFALVVHRRRIRPHLAVIGEPLLYVFLLFAIVLALGYSNGGLDAPDDTERLRFTHRLPGDNVIPLVVANALKFGGIVSPLFSDWLSSDRPPLQTGLYLLLTVRTNTLSYCIVAIWLQATYLFGVWSLAVATALPTPARRLIMLACCLLPTVIVNTFFTWPKLLSVTYLLLLFALLFRPRPPDEPRTATGLLIGGLAALSVLSHGLAFVFIDFVVLIFIPGTTVNHQGTYAAQLMATVFAFMVLTTRAPALALLFLGLQMITVSALYVIAIPHDPRVWPLWVTGIAAAVALFAYLLAPTWMNWRSEQPIIG